MENLARRQFLQLMSAATACGLLQQPTRADVTAADVEAAMQTLRPITTGPKFHWRGYYDKQLFSADDTRVAVNEVEFEHRSPTADDEISVGIVHLNDGDRFQSLGVSRAWNWQQGCMLQWVPGSDDRVIWNDRQADQFCSRICDVGSGETVTLEHPVYALGPDGRSAFSVDFRRLDFCRPGYGYATQHAGLIAAAPDNSGLQRINLASGQAELIFSYADGAALPYNDEAQTRFNPSKSIHWFNHVLASPSGDRVLFLHRWREMDGSESREQIAKTPFDTRMITVNRDGSEPYVVDPYGRTSHFVWRDDAKICAWAWHPSHRDAFYLLPDRGGEVEVVAPQAMPVNGHNTYLANTDARWILNDTYPDQGSEQTLYVYDVETGERHDLGRYLSPERYRREYRCDLHPAGSNSGRQIVFDSPHAGNGRQVYWMDVSSVVG